MYAIVRSGGRQHRVEVGDVLEVDKIDDSVGSSVSWTPLLLVDGTTVTSDQSALGSASVTAEVLAATGALDDPVGLEVLAVDRVGRDALLLVWRAVRESGESTLRSSLWVRSGERWLQRFHQGTPEA